MPATSWRCRFSAIWGAVASAELTISRSLAGLVTFEMMLGLSRGWALAITTAVLLGCVTLGGAHAFSRHGIYIRNDLPAITLGGASARGALGDSLLAGGGGGADTAPLPAEHLARVSQFGNSSGK